MPSGEVVALIRLVGSHRTYSQPVPPAAQPAARATTEPSAFRCRTRRGDCRRCQRRRSKCHPGLCAFRRSLGRDREGMASKCAYPSSLHAALQLLRTLSQGTGSVGERRRESAAPLQGGARLRPRSTSCPASESARPRLDRRADNERIAALLRHHPERARVDAPVDAIPRSQRDRERTEPAPSERLVRRPYVCQRATFCGSRWSCGRLGFRHGRRELCELAGEAAMDRAASSSASRGAGALG